MLIRISGFLTSFLGFAAMAQTAQSETTAQPLKFRIEYTGRTLGYARTPDAELYPGDKLDRARSSLRTRERSKAAQAYKDLFEKNRPELPYLRLSMGDNFSPSLFSRTFQMEEDPAGGKDCGPAVLRRSKDRFTREDPVRKQDNVAQFFIENRYDVLVPGKHDFYFGSERLQDLAKILRRASRPVHMLAANLIVSTVKTPSALNAFPRTPERFAKHKHRGEQFDTDFHDISIDFPDAVLPYKRQFGVKNVRRVLKAGGNQLARPDQLSQLSREEVKEEPLIRNVQICWEPGTETAGEPDHIPLPGSNNCTPLVAADSICDHPPAHLASTCAAFNAEASTAVGTQRKHPSADMTFLFEQPEGRLRAGLNHLFCAELVDSRSKYWTCKPFSVQDPFFKFDDAPEYEAYALIETSGQKFAVFGVVDSDLLTNVGLLNYGWFNKNKTGLLWSAVNGQKYVYDTNTQAAAADFSLVQALEQCKANEECRNAPKVLMAQMSYAKAAQLIGRFSKDFAAVISQADPDHQTGDVTMYGASDKFTKPVLTPDNPFKADTADGKPSARFEASVSFATIEAKDNKWTLNHMVSKYGDFVREDSTACPDNGRALSEYSMEGLKHLGIDLHARKNAALDLAPSDPVRYLALTAMRMRLETDIAFLQTRDLYDADQLSSTPIHPKEIQNQLNRVLWKGDLIMRMHVTGATLRKVMKQSKKFDDLDKDALSTEIEKGRSLTSLGIYADPKDSDAYFVNGVRMDDTALYSVAASQYIAAGDTGYTDLATPDVPPPIRMEDFNPVEAVAEVVCRYIADAGVNAGCWHERLTPNSFFDITYRRPFDKRPGFDTTAHYKSFWSRLRLVPDYDNGPEEVAQRRHFFAMNLESMDLNYTGTYISRAREASRFAGISVPGVSTTSINAVTFGHKLRGIWDFNKGTLYFLSDMNIARTSTPPLPSITANMYGLEAGATWRIPHARRPSWLSVQFSGRYEGEPLEPPPTKVTVRSGDLAFFKNPQISTVYGRAGLRAEFMDTYVEMGVEEIDSRNVLSAYRFNVPGNQSDCVPTPDGNFNCPPPPTAPTAMPQTLAAYLGMLPPQAGIPVPMILKADYLTAGAYLNFSMKFPLWSRKNIAGTDQSVYLLLSNKGDLYLRSHTDTPVQTRYLDRFTAGFSIPIYGKVSLTPKVDYVLYQNKVNNYFLNGTLIHATPSLYRSLQPTLALSYGVNWREGTGKRRALGYGAITTQQPVRAGGK